jgi:hypothetical protein
MTPSIPSTIKSWILRFCECYFPQAIMRGATQVMLDRTIGEPAEG